MIFTLTHSVFIDLELLNNFPVTIINHAPHRVDIETDMDLLSLRYALPAIDVNQKTSPKKLLLADMDSTLITCECLDEIADFANVKSQISAITERAMNGEIDFTQSLKQRVALLRGLPVSLLEDVYRDRVKITDGAHDLIKKMNESGAITVLVSGGFTFFSEKIAKNLGCSFHHANQLAQSNNVLTGELKGDILDGKAKLRFLHHYAQKNQINLKDTMAIGDGANDLDMLKAAGFGIAFHAKPIVVKQIEAQINHSDLSSLLALQGLT